MVMVFVTQSNLCAAVRSGMVWSCCVLKNRSKTSKVTRIRETTTNNKDNHINLALLLKHDNIVSYI